MDNDTQMENYDYFTKSLRRTWILEEPAGKLHDKLHEEDYLKQMLVDIKSLLDDQLEMKYPHEYFYHYIQLN